MERPNPAVGQVWRDQHGFRFVIKKDPQVFWYRRVYESGEVSAWQGHSKGCVSDTDTYEGLFDGFRVKETT